MGEVRKNALPVMAIGFPVGVIRQPDTITISPRCLFPSELSDTSLAHSPGAFLRGSAARSARNVSRQLSKRPVEDSSKRSLTPPWRFMVVGLPCTLRGHVPSCAQTAAGSIRGHGSGDWKIAGASSPAKTRSCNTAITRLRSASGRCQSAVQRGARHAGRLQDGSR